jgi:hypothetical protein
VLGNFILINLFSSFFHSKIHSPSPQAFETFDDFLLLGKGGKIIYFGPRDKALEYFANIGFNCPPEER